MNQVSWLIYLADVSGNMGIFFGCLGAACILGGIAFFVTACILISEVNRWTPGDQQQIALKTFKSQRRNAVICACFAFLFWFGAALTPSTNTVLAIAASQFGEQMLHTKTANLSEQALNSWLQKQITKVEAPAAEKK